MTSVRTQSHMSDAESPQANVEGRPGAKEPIVVVTRDAREEDSLKLGEIVDVARTGRWWIIGCAVLFVALAAVHAAMATRVYRGETLVAVSTESSSALGGGSGNALGAIASLAGLDIGGAQGKRGEYIALLSSRAVLQQFIRHENLLPVLFKDRWDPQTSKWRGEEPSMDQAAEFMRRKVLNVADDRRTGLVTVRIQWPDPNLSAEWANKLVAFVNDRVRERAITEARSSIEFLNREIGNTEAIGVKQASFRLIEANLNRIMLANTQREYALRVIDPASPPDLRRYVAPRPVIEVAAGLLLGCLVGLVIAWLRFRPSKEA